MASAASITVEINAELVAEINRLRNENLILKTDLSSLRAQLLKARRQRHDAHNQLRAVLARTRPTPSDDDPRRENLPL